MIGNALQNSLMNVETKVLLDTVAYCTAEAKRLKDESNSIIVRLNGEKSGPEFKKAELVHLKMKPTL